MPEVSVNNNYDTDVVKNAISTLDDLYVRLKGYSVTHKSIIDIFVSKGWSTSTLHKHGCLSKGLYEGYLLRAYIGSKRIEITMRRTGGQIKKYFPLPNFRYKYGLSLAMSEVKAIIVEFKTLVSIKNMCDTTMSKADFALSGIIAESMDPNILRIIESNGLMVTIHDDEIRIVGETENHLANVLKTLWNNRAKKL